MVTVDPVLLLVHLLGDGPPIAVTRSCFARGQYSGVARPARDGGHGSRLVDLAELDQTHFPIGDNRHIQHFALPLTRDFDLASHPCRHLGEFAVDLISRFDADAFDRLHTVV